MSSAVIERRLVERVPFSFHPEIHFGHCALENVPAFYEAAADGIGVGAAGCEEMGGLRIRLFDGLVAGTAGSSPRHQRHRENHHTNLSFKPTCRAPCLSGL